MKRAGWLLLVALAAVGAARAEVRTEAVEYRSGETVMNGYLAYDDAVQGKRPGVLVVHEWWGHNDYARKRARMLAELGYTALAVDMYGGGKTADHPEDAGRFASEARKDLDVAEARFLAAREVLARHPTVDAGQIAAIGYCFGGGVVLEMARRGVDLDAVASFHGSLATPSPARPGAVKARVLVFTGEADPMVPPEQVSAFEQEMQAAGASYSVVVYPGAKHSFTSPEADALGQKFGLPLAYDAKADAESWAAMQRGLKDAFAR